MRLRLLIILLTINYITIAQQSNTFMVFGDPHYSSSAQPFKESLLFEFVIAALEEKVDFVFITGDLILTDPVEEHYIDSLLVDWKFILDTLALHNIKLYACRGNYDLDGEVSWETLFSGNYSLPENGPDGEKLYTYSFTYDNFLFLSLDQYKEYNRINQDWLDEQLSQNDKPFVFVASHEPAFKVFHNSMSSYPEERDRFWSSLSINNYTIYLCGHSHFYDHSIILDKENNSDKDIHQFVLGTGGGKFHYFIGYSEDNGNWEPINIFYEKSYGYLRVEVEEDRLNTQWKHRVAPFTFEDGGDNYNHFLTDISQENIVAYGFKLLQNHPNPFNPTTTIKYSIPKVSNITLKVFDVLGCEVTTLVNKEQPQGNYEIEFAGKDLKSGIYLYRLKAGVFVETKKMILLK